MALYLGLQISFCIPHVLEILFYFCSVRACVNYVSMSQLSCFVMQNEQTNCFGIIINYQPSHHALLTMNFCDFVNNKGRKIVGVNYELDQFAVINPWYTLKLDLYY